MTTQAPSKGRDRPYWKVIKIQDEHTSRMHEILSTITRKRIIKYIEGKDNHTTYHIRLKQQELLMIKLTIPNVLILLK